MFAWHWRMLNLLAQNFGWRKAIWPKRDRGRMVF
jgi:hypothetical protein